MEERKRASDEDMENPTSNLIQSKRLKPEEIMGGRIEDPTKAVTRLFLNRSQFSRVIGKGGQTITHVRSATGVSMKGADVDEDSRLVILNGTLDQVLNAFDIISELLLQASIESSNNLAGRANELLSINLLLEHTKAGKAVGTKGAMMQSIKTKSGAFAIRIEKEPMDIQGISLRKLTIEGNIAAIKRAHLLVHELYMDPSALSKSVVYNAFNTTNSLGNGLVESLMPSMSQHGIKTAPSLSSGSMDHPMISSSNDIHLVPVPFPTLVNYGVQPETVRQLTEMKAYLLRHFGLDLNISREIPNPAPVPRLTPDSYTGNHLPSPYPNNRILPLPAKPTIESIIEARRASNPTEICFSVPKNCVGGVIGKGGQYLRDLQNEFGVRVYIEKEDFGGKRLVVLAYAGHTTEGTPLENSESPEIAVQRCQKQIESIIEEQLKLKSDSNSESHLE